MGERTEFQPLTLSDKITVILYRTGIILSMLIILFITFVSFSNQHTEYSAELNVLLILLYISTGLSVFFIHLYMSKLHRLLKRLYYLSIISLFLMIYLGHGDPVNIILSKTYGPLLLLPLSGCLGFVTAKEAFCFGLMEGYLIALILPLYLLIYSAGGISYEWIRYSLVFLACAYTFFTFRKVFMPIHYDIGDKSAYR
jgi:uncharacterized integral membrane protein